MQKKRAHMHMHWRTQAARSHEDTLAHPPTQKMKNHNNPRRGHWQTQALKVITEIVETFRCI